MTVAPPQEDPRTAALCAILAELLANRSRGADASESAPVRLVEAEASLDAALAMARELAAMDAVAERARVDVERRSEELLNVVLALVAFDYQTKAPLSDRNDAFDGLAAGLNMLGEELAASTISKGYVTNILQSMTDLVAVVDRDGVIAMANGALCTMSGYAEDELIGMPITVLFEELSTAAILETRRAYSVETSLKRKAGEPVVVSMTASLMLDRYEVTGLVCVARDLTEIKSAEEERLALHDAVNRQAILLEEQLTPIIPIADDVLICPLVGTVSQERVSRIMESLLASIVERRARLVLLDVTGVRAIDAPTVQGLLRAADAVRLIGAKLMFTGIRPEVAAAIVESGIDMKGLVTFGTLQRASQFALGLRSTRG